MSQDADHGVATDRKAFRLTTCCERRPVVGYGHTRCPGCGRYNPRTIRRVVTRAAPQEDSHAE